MRSSSRSSLLRCSEVNLVAYCSAVSSIRPLRCSVFPLPLLRCSRSWSPYCGAVRPSCCGAAFTIFPCKLRQQFPLPQIPAGSFVSPRRGAVFYHNPPAAVQLDIDILVFIVHEKEVIRDNPPRDLAYFLTFSNDRVNLKFSGPTAWALAFLEMQFSQTIPGYRGQPCGSIGAFWGCPLGSHLIPFLKKNRTISLAAVTKKVTVCEKIKI